MNEEKLFLLAKSLRDRGLTWENVAKELNKQGYRTKKGFPFCNKLASLIVIDKDPSYRSFYHKSKRKVVVKNNTTQTTPNELAIDLILSTKTLSIKDRLEIAMKLL